MALDNFIVSEHQPNADRITVCAWHGQMLVVASVPKFVIEDALGLEALRGAEALRIVRSNAALFERVVTGKFDRGECVEAHVDGAARMRVAVTLADIEATGERLSAGVLRAWPISSDVRGRFGPT
jgi:hypothetical protein